MIFTDAHTNSKYVLVSNHCSVHIAFQLTGIWFASSGNFLLPRLTAVPCPGLADLLPIMQEISRQHERHSRPLLHILPNLLIHSFTQAPKYSNKIKLVYAQNVQQLKDQFCATLLLCLYQVP